MTCRNCGREINDGSVFCPHCGTTQALSPESPWNAASGGSAPAWEGPEGDGKKKTGLFIGIGVAVLAVIALVAVFAGGLFSNPKKQVEAAFVKSAAAYTQAWKKLDLPDTAQWQREQNISQYLTLALKDINSGLIGYDLSALSGLEVLLSASYNGGDRYAAFDLTANWAEEELLSLSMTASDPYLWFNSPQFTGNTHYGVNTETLGTDLTKMTGDDSMEDLSFNLFELVDTVLEKMDQEQLKQDITAASKSLWDQAKVEKTGSKGVNLSGVDTKATAYQVTIPQEALEQFVDDLETALSVWNYAELYEEMFRSMGMPREDIEDFLDELEDVDPYGELFDGLRDAIAEFGGLELEVCLSGGYVSAVRYDDGAFVNIALYLGGGEDYVDDLVLKINVDDQFIVVESAGDHGGRSGVFTDTTTVKGSLLGLTSLNSDLRYDPQKFNDNFSWELSIPGAGSLEMAGALDSSEVRFDLDLDDVTLKVMGADVCTLSLSYLVEHRAVHGGVPPTFQSLTRMDPMELMTAALDVQKRAEAWAGEMEELFTSRLPAGLLYGILY